MLHARRALSMAMRVTVTECRDCVPPVTHRCAVIAPPLNRHGAAVQVGGVGSAFVFAVAVAVAVACSFGLAGALGVSRPVHHAPAPGAQRRGEGAARRAAKAGATERERRSAGRAPRSKPKGGRVQRAAVARSAVVARCEGRSPEAAKRQHPPGRRAARKGASCDGTDKTRAPLAAQDVPGDSGAA